jgi:hypothetical protein
MHEGTPEIVDDRWLKWISIIAALAVVVLSFLASPLFRWVSSALLKTF